MEWNIHKNTLTQIIHSIIDLGYTVIPLNKEKSRALHLKQEIKNLQWRAWFAGISFLVILIPMQLKSIFPSEIFSRFFPWFSAVLSIIVFITTAAPAIRMSWRSLRSGLLIMDTLIVLGSSSALLYSLISASNLIQSFEGIYFDGVAAILFFLNFGRLLEHRARATFGNPLANIDSFLPQKARIVSSSGKSKLIPIDKIKPKMKILVLAGEVIPIDGKITSGNSQVDEALLTGEPYPRFVKLGDKVKAVVKNLTKKIEITLEDYKDKKGKREIDKLILLLKHNLVKTPKISKFSEKVIQYMIPSILSIAIISGTLAWLITGEIENAFARSLATLLISCPCAIGLALPLAISFGQFSTRKEKLFISDGESIERLSQANTLFFDKTGTLTTGLPEVTETKIFDKKNIKKLLQIANVLESHSSHPFAQAIVNYTENKNFNPIKINIKNLKEKIGLGMYGNIEGKNIFIGQPSKSLKSPNLTHNLDVIMTVDKKPVIGFCFSEKIRDGAKNLVKELKNLGIEVGILSGDSESRVHSIAQSLCINSKYVYGGCSPNKKAEKVKEIKKNGNIVAFVGDGLNDAPVMAAADIGIASPEATELAKSAASIIIKTNRLNLVGFAVRLTKKIVRLMHQNLIWAIVYNITMIPLAALNFLNPKYASIAMGLSSISVILNSLRLIHSPKK